MNYKNGAGWSGYTENSLKFVGLKWDQSLWTWDFLLEKQLLNCRVEWVELEKTRVEGHGVFKTKLEKDRGIKGLYQQIMPMMAWDLVWAIKGSEAQWKAGSEGWWIPGPGMIKELLKVLEAAGQKHLIWAGESIFIGNEAAISDCLAFPEAQGISNRF